MARHVYLSTARPAPIWVLRDAGYYALDALRIEQASAWGAELGPDETPWEAGLSYAVKLDRDADFIGKAALLAARENRCAKKLVTLVPDSPALTRAADRSCSMAKRWVNCRRLAGPTGPAPAWHWATSAARARTNRTTAPNAAIELWGETVPVKLYDR